MIFRAIYVTLSPDLDLIKPTAFYSNESEKVKLNWFLYELARGIYQEIDRKLNAKLKEHQIDGPARAQFSIHLAKRMKEIIYQKLAGKIEKVYFSHKMVDSYFPDLEDNLVNQMLDAISEAWDEQLSMCEICPTRCISEKDAYCTMFDEELT